MLTVQQVYDFINALAPFDTQVEYDNSGLLVGHPAQEVHAIQMALDVTDRVIDEAITNGANLIVTHHPLMFSPIKRLVETDHQSAMLCRLIRHGISLISAHTNLDQAAGGCNDILAERIGLTGVTGEGFVRVGSLPQPMTAQAFAAQITRALGDTVRIMGDPDACVRRVGVCSGAGADEWQLAAQMGADAFLTGEAKHHLALEAAAKGVVLFEAGHRATEEPAIFALGSALQNSALVVQYKVRVFMTGINAYR